MFPIPSYGGTSGTPGVEVTFEDLGTGPVLPTDDVVIPRTTSCPPGNPPVPGRDPTTDVQVTEDFDSKTVEGTWTGPVRRANVRYREVLRLGPKSGEL